MLELSKELKITIINVKSYHRKGKQHEKIGNFSREKYWKSNGMLEIKNKVTETKKNVFYGLISRYKIAEEGNSESDDTVNRNYANWNTEKEKRVEKIRTKHLRPVEYQTGWDNYD